MKSKRILSLLLVLSLLLCLAPAAALAEGTIAETEAVAPGDETQDVADGYYLVGSMNNWTPSAAYRFETNPSNSTEYMLSTTLTAGQELKVVQVEGGSNTNWYPGGDNYVVDADHAGSVNIYFKPEYNGGWSAFGGYFYIEVVAVEDPTYTVGVKINGAEPHGTLSTDCTEAHEGDTITVTVTPEEGYMLTYIEAPAITKVNDSTYTFPMPGYDTKVYATFKLGPGFYFDNTDRNVPDYYVPEEKFVPSSSPFGEWERETVLTEGKYLDVYAVYAPVYAGDKTGYCWCSNTMNHYYASWATQPKVSAEQAGHAMVFLTETEREGYIKAVHTQKTYIDPSFAWDAWIVIKNFHPIVIESAQGGAVTADQTEAIEGQTVTLTVTPEEGYELESLTVVDAEGNAIAVEDNSFLMPDGPVTVTPVFAAAAASSSAQVYGSSISLKGNIGLNFYVIPSEALTADSEAYVMLNETRYPIAEASTRVVSGLTLYQFSFEVPAKNMNDTVTLRVYSGDGSQAALYRYSDGEDLSATGYQTSVQEYIQKTRETSTDEELLALLNAMSDYGSMAQLQFSYNADTRVPVLADLSQVTVEDLAGYDYTITPGKYTGVSFNSASLSLQSETVLRIYLKLDEGEIGDYTFKLGTKVVQPYQSGSYWIVEISNIAAKDLDRLYTVTVTSASGKVLTVKACALGYCYRVLASDRTSDTLKDTVRAIYLYNQAANAYFG